jgi:hypothetical protein
MSQLPVTRENTQKRGSKPGELRGNAGKMGRKPGTPNKATSNAREAIALFVEGNAHRLQGWLDQIAEEQGPEKAVRCFLDLLEYHIPKLARTENTGPGGSEPVLNIRVIRE